MFFCAISGSPPVAPVVSKTSGTVYEKALIERYIEENGTDPISGEALTLEDLVDVKAKPSTLPPRTATQTSIPSLLTALQSEYDAIMLESLEIKKAYQHARQELANSLYREDAATRVMARLMKERDEARDALASIQKTIGFAPPSAAEGQGGEQGGDVEMQEEQGPLGAEVLAKITETERGLSSTRKKRKPEPGYVNKTAIKEYVQTAHVPSLHATKPAGITAMDLAQDGNVVVTGGADKAVQIFDLTESKVLGTLKGHTKAVTHVVLREREGEGRVAISGSADKTVRVWGEDAEGKWAAKGSLTGHKGDITGLGLHPSGAYIGAGSSDSTWSLYDIDNLSTIATYGALPNVEGSFSYASFGVHPDGILYAGGTKDGLLRVWDCRNASALAATIPVQSQPVTTLSFSQNGYYLATGSNADPTVSVVDLRKLAILSSWALPAENSVSEVRFDESAQFLGVSGTDYRVYANKTWDECLTYEDNAGVISAARFGPKGDKIVLGGMDRSLRVLGVQAA